jgi:hypothetical protein
LDSLFISLMLYFAFILAWVIITYRFGDWKNWRVYYPTILFFCTGNLIAYAVFHHSPLWEFKSNTFSHFTIDLIQMIFIFSCTTILFLQYYPKNLAKQILYILMWVVIYSGIELVFHLLGGIKYNSGWSIWWSATHNMYQFIFLRIHYKKPILAWILAFITLGIIMTIFRVSF